MEIHQVQADKPCKECGNTMFKPSLSNVTRGHTLKMQVQHQPGPRRAFFPARVTMIWNVLSQDLVDALNVSMVKTRLTREWINHESSYNYCFSY